jgi:hypothetical protein
MNKLYGIINEINDYIYITIKDELISLRKAN